MRHFQLYQNKILRNRLVLTLCAFVSLLALSCKKFIEISAPHTSLNGGNVYTVDATAAAVLTNVYAEMSEKNNMQNETPPLTGQDITSISLYAALSADELALFDLNYISMPTYYRNELDKTNSPNYWKSLYPKIFIANNTIDGLNASNGLTPAVKQHLFGEALFIRAFCYFYLVNLYGDVPLVLDLDYKTSSLLGRASVSDVYQQIIKDLTTAQGLLSQEYLQANALTPYTTGAEERVRPNKWVATALLSRVYLYNGEYTKAEAEATKIINNTSLFDLTTLGETFLKNNKEAIWQLQPVGNNNASNAGEGRLFILPAGGPNSSSNPVYLSLLLVNSFESGDFRKQNWVNSVIVGSDTFYYANKYKIGNVVAPTQEYPTIFRLSEQYLIRAEARAQLDNTGGAQTDLNIIRNRAGLSTTSANEKPSLLNAILKERRVELFTEWGHRWLDMKRTKTIDNVMNVVAPLKGGSWESYKALFPLPESDLLKDPNLVQNPGYN